jgi:hypothetical protein
MFTGYPTLMTTPLHLQFAPVAQALLFTLTQERFTLLAPRDFPEGTQEGAVRFFLSLALCRRRTLVRPADLKGGHDTTSARYSPRMVK